MSISVWDLNEKRFVLAIEQAHVDYILDLALMVIRTGKGSKKLLFSAGKDKSVKEWVFNKEKGTFDRSEVYSNLHQGKALIKGF
jgi:hypothetical protein